VDKKMKRVKREWLVFSVGGSLISQDKINENFLKNLSQYMKKLLQKYNVAVVVGGGAIARQYISSSRKIGVRSSRAHDLIGIAATHLNAQLVHEMFGLLALDDIITNPDMKLQPNKRLIVAAGSKPGWSTDYVATRLARNLKAKVVINLSKEDYVYSSDPRKNPAAKALKQISWKEMRKIVGSVWRPGVNAPFDPVASKEAEKMKLTVVCINGNRIGEVSKFLQKKKFIGTIIT
jgi:uridylate kinase